MEHQIKKIEPKDIIKFINESKNPFRKVIKLYIAKSLKYHKEINKELLEKIIKVKIYYR